jgi:hypothetical protein
VYHRCLTRLPSVTEQCEWGYHSVCEPSAHLYVQAARADDDPVRVKFDQLIVVHSHGRSSCSAWPVPAGISNTPHMVASTQ